MTAISKEMQLTVENQALREKNERLRSALQRIVDSDGRFDTMFSIAKDALGRSVNA